MTPTQFFSVATEWIFGDAIDTAPATDAEIVQFHYLSEWQGATVAFDLRSGTQEGVVLETDTDEHGIWLHVEYEVFSHMAGRWLVQQQWLNENEVTWINAAPKSKTATAVAIAVR